MFYQEKSIQGNVAVYGVGKAALIVVRTPDGDLKTKFTSGTKEMVKKEAEEFGTWTTKRVIASLSTFKLLEIAQEKRIDSNESGNDNALLIKEIYSEINWRKKHGDKPLYLL